MVNNSRFFFVLLGVGAALGISSIWLYPYLSFKLGGLFFIPYFIALIVLGMPLLMLEFSIGQYFNKNVVDLFASVRKWFSSIGWLMIFNAFIVMSYYAVALSWHIVYLFTSFGLQWKNYGAESYFFGNVIQVSKGFSGFTQFSLPVFIALIMAWVVIFFYIKRGFESMKKGFMATFPIFIILMLFFLLYSLTLDNALDGVYSFLKPRLENFFSLDIWVASFSLAVVSLGLSFGIMHALAGKCKGFAAENSMIIAVFELITCFIAGFIMFSILGFLSVKSGIGVDKLASNGISFSFTVLAQALPFFYKPTLLSILFFMLLSIFFIFGAASLAYSITHVLVHKFRTKHRNAAVFVSGFGFLLGLLFIIKPGFYMMDIAGHFVYYNILIAVLLEALAIGWFFDSEKISNHINQNSILKIGALWRLLIRYIIPLTILLLLLFRIKSDISANYSNYPQWALLVFGVGIVTVPLVIAFLMPRRILDSR